jgi:hypothetical protein
MHEIGNNSTTQKIALFLYHLKLLKYWSTSSGSLKKKYPCMLKIAKELSDVLYWVLLMSHDLGIDIEKAFEIKMKENAKKYPIKKAKGKHTKYTEL